MASVTRKGSGIYNGCRRNEFRSDRGRFTKDLSLLAWIRWNIRLLLFRLKFLPAKSAQQSCCEHYFETVSLLDFGWEENDISIEFKIRWESRSKGECPLDRISDTAYSIIVVGMSEKSHGCPFAHNLFLSCQIVLKFLTIKWLLSCKIEDWCKRRSDILYGNWFDQNPNI